MPPRKAKSDGEALVAAVCAAPDDDTPRLVYADWLDEQGRPDRAELIRVQVELARLDGHDPRRPDLEKRAGRLLLTCERELLAEVPAWARGRVEVRRGFAAGVRVGLRTFVKQGGGLFRQAPITTVELTNVLADLARLADCPHLPAVRDLHLYDLDPTVLPDLLGSPRVAGLCGLHLQRDFTYPGPPTSLAAISGSSRLPPLDRLSLANRHVDASALSAFVRHSVVRSVAALGLWNTNLTAAEVVAAIGPLRGLRELDLGHTWHLSDDGVRTLAESPALARLTTLNLGGSSRITDAGARTLAASPHLGDLTDLGLDGTGVTDAGLEALTQSPNLPRLTRIGVFGNRLDRPRWDFWECRRAPSRWSVQWVWVRPR